MVWRLRLRPDPGLGADEEIGLVESARGLLRLMVGLPRLTIAPGATPVGARLRWFLAVRRYGLPKNRVAQAILVLAPTEEECLAGGRRLMRRQMRKAAARGLTARRLSTREQRLAVLEALTPRVPGMPEWAPGVPERDEDEWWVADDADGTPLAFAILGVDGPWALLDGLVSTDHTARYFLHTRIAVSLGQAGVRCMLTDAASTLRLPRDRQYFQFITGYRIAHLRLPRRAGRSNPR